MKAKIIKTICAIVGALALVFIPAEASTIGLQILWSGSWLIVFLLCAKGIEKFIHYIQKFIWLVIALILMFHNVV